MSYENPYEASKPASGGGGNGGGQRAWNNGGGKPGGGNFPQREPLTPEQLQKLKLPCSVVITGNDQMPDAVAMTLDTVVKMVEAKRIPIRCGGQSETDKNVIKFARNEGKWLEYHLPWNKFDDIDVSRGAGSGFNTDECFEYAKRYFVGDFESANKFVRANHGKTARLLFGKNLKNSARLVIVWTDDGAETAADTNNRSGIGGHVIRMATAAGIPVVNLKNPNAVQRVQAFLENINVQSQQQAQPAGQQQQGGYGGQHSGYSGNGNGGAGEQRRAGGADAGFGADNLDDIPY